MQFQVAIIILMTIVIGLLLVTRRAQSVQSAGAPFSNVGEQEMTGIPSWAGRPNPKNPARPVLVTDKSRITYYGHGIPLVPVEPGPMIGPMKIVHNTRLAVKPECCPSPYSTDQGCLCGAIEDIQQELRSI